MHWEQQRLYYADADIYYYSDTHADFHADSDADGPADPDTHPDDVLGSTHSRAGTQSGSAESSGVRRTNLRRFWKGRR